MRASICAGRSEDRIVDWVPLVVCFPLLATAASPEAHTAAQPQACSNTLRLAVFACPPMHVQVCGCRHHG